MKKEILIASIAPAFWVCFSIWYVGTPPAPHEPGEMLTGGIVIAAAIMVIPCAVVGYLCGKSSKGE